MISKSNPGVFYCDYSWMKSAKAALKSGDFVGVKMKIKNNIVYKIYFHV